MSKKSVGDNMVTEQMTLISISWVRDSTGATFNLCLLPFIFIAGMIISQITILCSQQHRTCKSSTTLLHSEGKYLPLTKISFSLGSDVNSKVSPHTRMVFSIDTTCTFLPSYGFHVRKTTFHTSYKTSTR